MMDLSVFDLLLIGFVVSASIGLVSAIRARRRRRRKEEHG